MGFSKAILISTCIHLLVAAAMLVGRTKDVLSYDVMAGLSSMERINKSESSDRNNGKTREGNYPPELSSYILDVDDEDPDGLAFREKYKIDKKAAPVSNSAETIGAMSRIAKINSGKFPPKYPSKAREMKLQGRVELTFEVLPSGSVGQVTIMESSGHEILDEAALKAVKKWPFFTSGEYILDKPVILTQLFAFILQK